MTKPSNPSVFFSQLVIRSWLACIFSGPPGYWTDEYDGMTEPTWCCLTAASNGGRCSVARSASGVMPWSILYEPVVEEPYVVPPSPAKCFAVASAPLSWRPSMTPSLAITSAGSSPKLSYVRPQRSSRETHRQGEYAHGTPVAFISAAAT